MNARSTKSPTTFQGVLEKIFWIAVPIILLGVVSMIPMIYGIKQDIAVVKVQSDFSQKISEKTWNLVNENYAMLQNKADDRTNTDQHKVIMDKMDTMEIRISEIYRRQTEYAKTSYPMNMVQLTPIVK